MTPPPRLLHHKPVLIALTLMLGSIAAMLGDAGVSERDRDRVTGRFTERPDKVSRSTT